MYPSDGIQHLRRGVMTNYQFYVALVVELVGILVSLAILLMLFRFFHRLEDRIERVQDRVHNDYEALIVKTVELETDVSRLEERLSLIT